MRNGHRPTPLRATHPVGPRPAPGVALECDDRHARLVGPDGCHLYALNDTALALWELCDGETTITEMVEAASAIFDVSGDAARRDIDAVIQQLIDAGLLIVPAEAPPGGDSRIPRPDFRGEPNGADTNE